MSLGRDKFRRELASLGLRNSAMVPPAARALLDGARYALGLLDESEYRDATDFEAGTSGSIRETAFKAGASGSIREMASYVLMANGKDRHEEPVVERAFAVADFGALITALGSMLIRDAYGQVPLAHRTFARRVRAKDYRPMRVGVVSSGQPLPRVLEGQTIQRRHGGEHAAIGLETTDYGVERFAEITDLGRKILVNDEVGFIAELVRQSGIRAAETERKVIWDLITANPGNFFHASHGNSASAASGATVSATTLALARTSMRAQIAPDGSQVASRLAIIVCGPATEDAWEAFLAGRVLWPQDDDPAALKPPRVLIEPRITDQSWYGFADYRLGAGAIEYAYLEGSDRGLTVENQPKAFASEGVSIKTSLDFGASLVDFRGAFRLAQSS